MGGLCSQLTTDLLPYVQSCANPVIYSFMSHSFRRRVRAGWRHCRRCVQRGGRGDDLHPGRRTRSEAARMADYGGVEEHHLEELGVGMVVAGASSRRRVSFGNPSARRWSSTTAAAAFSRNSRNSRRKTGAAATHLTVMTG